MREKNRSNGVLPMHIYYIYMLIKKYKTKEKIIIMTPD